MLLALPQCWWSYVYTQGIVNNSSDFSCIPISDPYWRLSWPLRCFCGLDAGGPAGRTTRCTLVQPTIDTLTPRQKIREEGGPLQRLGSRFMRYRSHTSCQSKSKYHWSMASRGEALWVYSGLLFSDLSFTASDRHVSWKILHITTIDIQINTCMRTYYNWVSRRIGDWSIRIIGVDENGMTAICLLRLSIQMKTLPVLVNTNIPYQVPM